MARFAALYLRTKDPSHSLAAEKEASSFNADWKHHLCVREQHLLRIIPRNVRYRDTSSLWKKVQASARRGVNWRRRFCTSLCSATLVRPVPKSAVYRPIHEHFELVPNAVSHRLRLFQHLLGIVPVTPDIDSGCGKQSADDDAKPERTACQKPAQVHQREQAHGCVGETLKVFAFLEE